MRRAAFLLMAVSLLRGQQTSAPAAVALPSLAQIKRIYVDQLTGGTGSFPLRDLLIAGINATGLFVLTDNPERADAILRGAADDHTFEDVYDSNESIGAHASGGRSSAGGSAGSKSILMKGSGSYGGASGSESESHHIKERKHEAFAALRLCTRDGDVLWSTTQESMGAKLRGASADVALKVARQLQMDYERAKRSAQ